MSGRPWDDWEFEYVRRWYPVTPTDELAEQLGRSRTATYQVAQRMGLKKDPSYYEAGYGGRTDGGKGAACRFPKGHVPWNKGIHWDSGGRSHETRFKKGQKPHSWQPIGSERVLDGYRQRKVTDTGYPPRDWRPVHVLHWERYRGPVPEGHIVVFKNGNKRDIRIANLECISRVENMQRNTVHRLPKELAEIIQLRGALNRQINKRRESNAEQD